MCQTQCIRDLSNVDVINPSIEVWNGWVGVNTAMGQSNEIAAGQATLTVPPSCDRLLLLPAGCGHEGHGALKDGLVRGRRPNVG